jgi:5-methyltetrahydrofolate--homocysteine methyltransferase
MLIPLAQRLREPDVIVADGAMGTMLLQSGLKPGECPERINLDARSTLEWIARLYLEAGAEIIQTNTFGGSPLKLAMYGLENQTEEINARAVQAVRNVVGNRAYISASCGPCGKILEPYGDASAELVRESFRRQLKAIIAEGVDLICIETMTDLSEATLAIRAAKSLAPSIPVFATMTFDPTPKGFHTIMGTSIQRAVEDLTDAGADVIGSNCGNGILNMCRIAEEFMKLSMLPVIIQSNAGLPSIKEGKAIYPETPEFMAEQSQKLIRLGVKIIGGCCGTTPEHTSALARTVHGLFSPT